MKPKRVHVLKNKFRAVGARCGNSIEFDTEEGTPIGNFLRMLDAGKNPWWEFRHVLCPTCADMITPVELLANTEL